jgi:hypothetical protein
MTLHIATVAVQHTDQLWPTVERALTAGAFVGAAIAGYWGKRNHSVNTRIEIAVNGKFADKVKELADVTERLDQMTAKRDQAVDTIVASSAAKDD